MARVYSTRFVSGQGLEGLHGYEVPAGFLAVVRDISWYIGLPTSEASLLAGIAQPPVYVALTSGSETDFLPTSGQWTGRQVANAGDVIYVNVQGGNADVSISGYLLSLP